ncbi:MAG: DUF433 domain-containing protein [Fimbriimonadaceae bacterium]
MTHSQPEHWMLPQLRRLARIKPAAFDELVGHIREFHAELYEELCLMGVEHGDLEQSECAVCLATDVSKLAVRLEIYRADTGNDENAILIETDENGVASLVDSGIFVWEIAREHRKQGSLEALKNSYASLTEAELRAALRYSERHSEEIERKIRAYEERFVKTDS